MKWANAEREAADASRSTQPKATQRETAGPSERSGSVTSLHRTRGNQAVQALVRNRRESPSGSTAERADANERQGAASGTRVDREAEEQTEEHATEPTADMCPRCIRRYRAGQPLHCPDCETSLDEAGESARGQSVDSEAGRPALTVSDPNDAHEREAERIAERVVQMRMPAGGTSATAQASTSHVRRTCRSCGEHVRAGKAPHCNDCEPGIRRAISTIRARPPAPHLYRACLCTAYSNDGEVARSRRADEPSTTSQGPDTAPPLVDDVLQSPGRPLDAATRTFMEERFDRDFSQVRVHTDAKAAESARAVDARAYTAGSHVVFGTGEYAPTTTEGRRLLAHELTHVAQQRPGTRAQPTLRRWSVSGDTATVDTQGDTLAGLAKRVGTSFRDWKCIRPVSMQVAASSNKPADFDREYFRYLRRGDEFDVSNLTATDGGRLDIHLFAAQSMDAQLANAMYGAQRSGVPDSHIDSASNSGQSPLEEMVIFGHSAGNQMFGAAATFTPANYDSEDPDPSYPLASNGLFPRRCWFTRNATVRAVGCESTAFGQDFAATYLRRGAKVITTTESVGPRCFGAAYDQSTNSCRWYNAIEFRAAPGAHAATLEGPFTTVSAFHAGTHWATIRGQVN